MTGNEGRVGAPIEMGSERVEAFSDAVMAVIITILALELRPPRGPTLHDLHPSCCPACSSTFWRSRFIAIYWNNHHHLLRARRASAAPSSWANMMLLFCLSP